MLVLITLGEIYHAMKLHSISNQMYKLEQELQDVRRYYSADYE